MRVSLLLPLAVFLATHAGCGFHPPDPGSVAARSKRQPQVARSSGDATDPGMLANTSGASKADEMEPETAAKDVTPPAVAGDSDGSEWRSLFDGKTLNNWKITKFGGEGGVTVEDGQIVMEFGQYITGITYDSAEELPKNNYELRFEAQRVDGQDFFCGVTFPVDDAHCSFIAGGWGGSVTGISSIDGMDASENETTNYVPFKNKQWYRFRVQVTPGWLQVWIDDKRFVDVDVRDHKLSTRIEVDLSMPLGFCCFDTRAAIRNIEIRELGPARQD